MAFDGASSPAPNGIKQSGGVNGYVEESGLYTDRLEGLQSLEERQIFELVDRLRDLDPKHRLELPYLVVCGSQSSGKSSILEAISGLQFPRGEGMKTKFVTELRFRAGNTASIEIQIVPDENRPPAEQSDIQKAKFPSKKLEDLESIVEDTERYLGLTGRRGFARDVLRLTITKPNQQPLTIIDAPGLIASHEDGHQLPVLAEEIVHSWIERPECLILAVLEADREAYNQPVLSVVQKVDPKGERTFGIITKPDVPDPGSDMEAYWVDKAQNISNRHEDFVFQKGWHVLRNRNSKENKTKMSLIERDQRERAFFDDRNRQWCNVNEAYRGIVSLQQRLRRIYLEHTKSKLEGIRCEITERRQGAFQELVRIKAQLAEPENLWNAYDSICRELVIRAIDCADGTYIRGTLTDVFRAPEFGLRSRIEERHAAFAKEIETNGHGLRQPNGQNMTDNPEEYRKRVQDMLRSTKGQEVKGTNSPLRLNQLFWEHSEQWRRIAANHVEQAHGHCRAFVEYMVMTELKGNLPSLPAKVLRPMVDKLEEELEKHRDSAMKELELLESDRLQPIKTENARFMKKVIQKQSGRLHTLIMKVADSEERTPPATTEESARFTSAHLSRLLRLETSQDIQDAEAEILGAIMVFYYEIAREVFIANVIHQVVERHLLRPLYKLFLNDVKVDHDLFIRTISEERNQTVVARKKQLEEDIQWLNTLRDELDDRMGRSI